MWSIANVNWQQLATEQTQFNRFWFQAEQRRHQRHRRRWLNALKRWNVQRQRRSHRHHVLFNVNAMTIFSSHTRTENYFENKFEIVETIQSNWQCISWVGRSLHQHTWARVCFYLLSICQIAVLQHLKMSPRKKMNKTTTKNKKRKREILN